MKNIIQGQLARLTATFKDINGALVDPTTVQLEIYRIADGDLATYTYGSSALYRESVGVYFMDVTTSPIGGVYNWRFISTGTGQNASQGSFYVTPDVTLGAGPIPAPDYDAAVPSYTFAGLPAFGHPGRLAMVTDNPLNALVMDIGTSWKTIGPPFNQGLNIYGQLGVGYARTDAQIEIDNRVGGHTMFSFRNYDRTEESATSYAGFLSNSIETQLAATFVRFVGDGNTYNNYKTVWATHLVDNAGDKTPLILFSNNSAKLLGGNTSALPWATALAANTFQIGNASNVINTDANGFMRIVGATSISPPAAGAAIELFYRLDGTHDEGQIQAYNRSTGLFKYLGLGAALARFEGTPDIAAAAAAMTLGEGVEVFYRTDAGLHEGSLQSYSRAASSYKPLTLGGSIVRIIGNANVAAVPTSGVGIEFYYRTDGAHDEGQIQAYNRATSTSKPLGIGGSYIDITTLGRALAGTPIVPTTGKGLEFFYRTDAGLDLSFLQSYDRAGSSFKPLSIGASMSRFDGTTDIAAGFTAGVGIECYYRLDGAHDEGQIQSYSRTASAFKGLNIDALTLGLNANSNGAVTIGGHILNYTGTTGRYFEGYEIADPAAPAANLGRLYFRDNGAGKTQLVVIFNSGAVQVIATQP